MAESIGSLRVELSASHASFRSDLDKAANASKSFTVTASKDFGAMASVLQGVGQAIGQTLISAFAGLGSAAIDAAGAAIKWSDAMGLSADKMNISAESAQKLKYVADQLDIPFATLEKSMGKMQVALAKSPEAFTRLGLSMADLKKMSPEEQLAAVADKLGGIEDPAQRAAAAQAIFGKGWQDLVPLLNAGGEAVRVLGADAERLGTVMDDSVIASGRDMDDTLTALSAVWDGLIRNFGAAITTSEPLHRLFEGLVEILGTFSKGVQDGQSDMRSFVDVGVVFVAQAFVELVGVIEMGLAVFKSLADMWAVAKSAAELLIAPMKLLWQVASGGDKGAAWKEYLATVDQVRLGMPKLNAELAANQKQLDSSVGTTSKMREALKGLVDNVAAGVGVTHEASEKNKKHATTLGQTAAELKKATADHDKWLASLRDYNKGKFVGPTLAELTGFDADQLQKAFSPTMFAAAIGPNMAKGFNQAVKTTVLDLSGMLVKPPSMGDAFKAGLSTGLKDIPNVILSALQGGGDVFKSVGASLGGALGKSIAEPATAALSGLLGKGLGGALGSVIPGLGTVLGSAIGSLAGKLFGNLFGGASKAAKAEMDKIRAEFISAQGGIEALKEKADKAQVSLDALFNAKGAEALKRAIGDIKTELDSWTEAHNELQEAIDYYDLKVDELGPKFRDQKLEETALGIYKRFELLKGSGADMVAVLGKMAPETNEWLASTIRAGGGIELAMRPVLLDLARQGLLLKENGEAYTELEVEGLGYTKTMSQMFTELITKLDVWLSKLLGIPSNIHTTVTTEYEERGARPGGGGGGGRPNQGGQEGTQSVWSIGPAPVYADRAASMMSSYAAAAGGGTSSSWTGDGGAVERAVQALRADILGLLPNMISRSVRDAVLLGAR